MNIELALDGEAMCCLLPSGATRTRLGRFATVEILPPTSAPAYWGVGTRWGQAG